MQIELWQGDAVTWSWTIGDRAAHSTLLELPLWSIFTGRQIGFGWVGMGRLWGWEGGEPVAGGEEAGNCAIDMGGVMGWNLGICEPESAGLAFKVPLKSSPVRACHGAARRAETGRRNRSTDPAAAPTALDTKAPTVAGVDARERESGPESNASPLCQRHNIRQPRGKSWVQHHS